MILEQPEIKMTQEDNDNMTSSHFKQANAGALHLNNMT